MEGCDGVAAPDGGLTQQAERDERRGRALFVTDQQHEGDDADQEHAGGERQDRQAGALEALQRQERRGDEEREQEHAAGIGAPRQALLRGRRQPERESEREQRRRYVDQENRAPAEMLGEESSGDGTERVGGDRDGGDIALIAGAVARRHGLADEGLRQRHQAAAAEPLHDATGGEDLDRRRQRAADGGAGGHRQRDEHQRLAAERVAHASIERCRDGGSDQIGDDDPGRALDASEIGRDGGQGGSDDGLVDDGQKHRQHQRWKDGEEDRFVGRLRSAGFAVGSVGQLDQFP